MLLPREHIETMSQTDGCQVMAAWSRLLLIEHSARWITLSKSAVLASEGLGRQNLKAGLGGIIINGP